MPIHRRTASLALVATTLATAAAAACGGTDAPGASATTGASSGTTTTTATNAGGASTTTTTSTHAGGAGGAGGGAAGGPTYWQDVAPIFAAKCATCHVDGGVTPFAMGDLDTVRKWAGPIKTAVAARTMPPWLAAPGCATYAADRSLTDAQIATVVGWVDAGTPEGDPKSPGAPLDTGPKRELTRVDRTLGMAASYTPQQDPDDYHCFVLDWPSDQVEYVTGFRANPGNPKVVHHMIAFLIPPSDVATVKALDDAEEGPGYTCFGGSGTNATWVGAWAPGGMGSDYPAGTGVKVAPGSKIVLQVHYNTLTAGRQPDQSTIDMKLDAKVDKEAWVQPWANPQWLKDKQSMLIPANTKDVKHSFSFDPTPFISNGKGLTIFASALHMHKLGHTARFSIEHANAGDECMLDIPGWNFHWQDTYEFTTPKHLAPGDKLTVECHWDNTTPKDVSWGEGTEDEMCLGTMYVTKDP
jgi:hypothetical protein